MLLRPQVNREFFPLGNYSNRILAHGADNPLVCNTINFRPVGVDESGDVELCEMVLEHGGKLNFIEGQSIGIIPPGISISPIAYMHNNSATQEIRSNNDLGCIPLLVLDTAIVWR